MKTTLCRSILPLAAALAAVVPGATSAQGAAPDAPVVRGPRVALPQASLRIDVALSQSQVVRLDAPASRVSVANPDVADIVVIGPSEFYVLAKDVGITNVLIWDRNNTIMSTVDVQVTHDLEGLKAKLAAVLPGNRIQVRSAQRSIVLSGPVPDAASADAALRLAQGYLVAEKNRDAVGGMQAARAALGGNAPVAAAGSAVAPGGNRDNGPEVINLMEIAAHSR
jgi:Flp pilus assembly secretin CpaC